MTIGSRNLTFTARNSAERAVPIPRLDWNFWYLLAIDIINNRYFRAARNGDVSTIATHRISKRFPPLNSPFWIHSQNLIRNQQYFKRDVATYTDQMQEEFIINSLWKGTIFAVPHVAPCDLAVCIVFSFKSKLLYWIEIIAILRQGNNIGNISILYILEARGITMKSKKL